MRVYEVLWASMGFYRVLWGFYGVLWGSIGLYRFL